MNYIDAVLEAKHKMNELIEKRSKRITIEKASECYHKIKPMVGYYSEISPDKIDGNIIDHRCSNPEIVWNIKEIPGYYPVRRLLFIEFLYIYYIKLVTEVM